MSEEGSFIFDRAEGTEEGQDKIYTSRPSDRTLPLSSDYKTFLNSSVDTKTLVESHNSHLVVGVEVRTVDTPDSRNNVRLTDRSPPHDLQAHLKHRKGTTETSKDHEPEGPFNEFFRRKKK